ncbi:MAG: type II toxin-antitoxin system mRNA interferase toxin, RelE/StbE family [Gemmatimonadetes bacterium]|nr:type II toxin-antitoxin system mRNA interferase toxin, RelE/StbE family [Gemmatimonadota bacterium]MDE3260201.1 type II toxin-antitoxin system mRNA interferase toxin, RelE/StbE family [Gemmatimonadota bacterium]
MWTVVEHRRVGRQVDSIPAKTLRRYETWKDVVFLSGPEGVRGIEGFRDEPRPGKKKGRRQSWLDDGWRVVYRVKNREIRVRAIRGQ